MPFGQKKEKFNAVRAEEGEGKESRRPAFF